MTLAALITAIVVLVLVGLALYLIETYIPMAAPFKLVIRVIVVLGLILYMLSVFGIYRVSAQVIHPCDIDAGTNFFARRNQPIKVAFCHSMKDDDNTDIPIGQLHAYVINSDNNNMIRDLGLPLPIGGASPTGDYYFESEYFVIQQDTRVNVLVEYNGQQALGATPILLDIRGGPRAPRGLRIVLSQ